MGWDGNGQAASRARSRHHLRAQRRRGDRGACKFTQGGVVAINAIHLDRIPQFDYDRLLWGERQIRSVANMTRADARDFLQLAAEIKLHPKVTKFPLDQANEALLAIKNDSIDGAAVIIP